MSFDWGSFVGGIVGGALSGVVTLLAAFRISGEQTRSREQSSRKHLEILLQRAASIPSPDDGYLAFVQAFDATTRLVKSVRESVLATQDPGTIDVAHRTLICLGAIRNALKLITATQGGYVDNDGGKATKALKSSLDELRSLRVPT